MRKERVVLEHHANAPRTGRDMRQILAAERDRAALGLDQPGNGAQHRRLATAARAKQRHDLSGFDVECDIADGVLTTIAMGQASDAKLLSFHGTGSMRHENSLVISRSGRAQSLLWTEAEISLSQKSAVDRVHANRIAIAVPTSSHDSIDHHIHMI